MSYEVVNVRNDSVRIRYGALVFDIKVIVDCQGNKRIVKPKGMYFTSEDFNVLVAIVLSAYEVEVEYMEKLNHEEKTGLR